MDQRLSSDIEVLTRIRYRYCRLGLRRLDHSVPARARRVEGLPARARARAAPGRISEQSAGGHRVVNDLRALAEVLRAGALERVLGAQSAGVVG
jgi:hypothetical protein